MNLATGWQQNLDKQELELQNFLIILEKYIFNKFD